MCRHRRELKHVALDRFDIVRVDFLLFFPNSSRAIFNEFLERSRAIVFFGLNPLS
jgi:hypothetical protein